MYLYEFVVYKILRTKTAVQTEAACRNFEFQRYSTAFFANLDFQFSNIDFSTHGFFFGIVHLILRVLLYIHTSI